MKVKAELSMHWLGRYLRGSVAFAGLSLCSALVCWTQSAVAQSCQTSSELEDATRTAVTTSGQRYFDMAAKGDTASMKQNAIASLSADFSGIENTIKEHQQDLAGAQATVNAVYMLVVDGTAPLPSAEFYCGVFGKKGQTSGSAVFTLDNLQPGKYAVVILDSSTAKYRTNFSLVLEQAGTDWKLGGLYIKPTLVAGHDSDWFAARAREYKAKGQMHNAWLFFVQARSLVSPLPFMSTLTTDKLYDESQGVQPADVPTGGKTADLAAGTAAYKLSAIFPQAVGSDLDLIVKYQASDVSNTTQAYQSNVAVIKALVAKYPETREAFAGVVARAVDPSGRDYGTLLVMKDVK